MNLIFLGPPGVGKGTQAKLCLQKYGMLHLSTGDMLRSAVENKTEMGLLIESIMKDGGLVDAKIVNQLVADTIKNIKDNKSFILDGYPRNVEQAKALQVILKENNSEIDKVIVFTVDTDILLSRIEKRNAEAKAKGQEVRVDDTAEILKKRLNTYNEQTAPLLDYYAEQGILVQINSMLSIEEVFAQIEDILRDNKLHNI